MGWWGWVGGGVCPGDLRKISFRPGAWLALNFVVSFGTVTLAGVGLLGGSLALALRRLGLAREVRGWVRRPEAVREAESLGLVDMATTDGRVAASGADLLVLCTPVGSFGPVAAKLVPHLASGAVVTDVGSVKGPVVAEMDPLCRQFGAVFVGSHPMAGSERTGMRFARAELMDGAVVVTTPLPGVPAGAVERVESLWRAVGARVLRMTAAEHDAVVARASHLPHVVACALAHRVLDPGATPDAGPVCATGFRDTTRVASGSAEMWRDILVANRASVLEAIDEYLDSLRQIRELVAGGSAPAIEGYLSEAKRRRDAWQRAGMGGAASAGQDGE